jgi:cytochrome c
MSKSHKLLLGSALALVTLAAPAFADTLGLGRTALPEEINAWDVAVLPDGTGLRPGKGDVATGEEVFANQCASCHGDFAEGIDSWPVLAGGIGSLTDRRPVKTVGSYWPHLSTVWDYVHRSMPFGAAQTTSVDETYAITAYILYSNGLVDDDFELTHENFTEIRLPNADGFVIDDRATTEYPLFRTEPCMSDCSQPVQITKRAVDLKVTPVDENGRPAGTLPDLRSASLEQTAPVAASEPVVEVAAATSTVDPALVAAGEKVFKKCAACHKVGDSAKNGTGPMLNGIVGRAAGSVDGFRYSKPLMAMAEAGLVWDDEAMHGFFENPKGFMKGTKMSFAGLKKADDRDALIAYLATFTE